MIEKVDGKVTKVTKTDIRKGSGCKVEAGQYLSANLVGATAADAKVFRSSWTDGRPVTMQTGQSKLIAGLEVGLGGMKVGGRRQINIPAAQAYGADGNADLGIAKNQDLTFIVDLLGVTDTPLYCNPAGEIPKGKGEGKPTAVIMPVNAPAKVKTTDIKPGAGKAAKKGNYLTLHYLGMACSTGEQFQSSWDTGEPFSLTIEDGGAIPGFIKGLTGAKKGMTRQIEIPAADAYGATGQDPTIGKNEPLVFVVEILDLADKAPAPTTTTTAAVTTTTKAG